MQLTQYQMEQQKVMQKNISAWKARVAKSAMSAVPGTGEVVASPLRLVMNNESTDQKEVYVEYFSTTNHAGDTHEVQRLKWYPTYVVVEETNVKALEDGTEEELSYASTVYTNFSGVSIRPGEYIKLLYGANDYKQLSVIVEAKDTRKLTELICKLG